MRGTSKYSGDPDSMQRAAFEERRIAGRHIDNNQLAIGELLDVLKYIQYFDDGKVILELEADVDAEVEIDRWKINISRIKLSTWKMFEAFLKQAVDDLEADNKMLKGITQRYTQYLQLKYSEQRQKRWKEQDERAT